MTNKAFEHYLLTCFNVKRGLDQENKRNSSEYLEKRFSIFESITIPSVKNQTCSNFLWIVFFDANTPEKYKKKIESIAKLSKFLPFYISNYSEVQIILKKSLNPETKYLITTNLDNDDAIAESFIQIIQNKFMKIRGEIYLINFLMGYTLSDKGLYMREYYSSPFHTLVEKISDNVISCLYINHTYLNKLKLKGAFVYQIICEPTWLQLIHETNISNKIEVNAVPILNLKSLNKFNFKKLPYNLSSFSVNSNNRFNSAFSQLTKKRANRKRKLKQSQLSILIFKLKLTVYTLIPEISIIYNKYKFLNELYQYSRNDKLSLSEFKELLSSLK